MLINTSLERGRCKLPPRIRTEIAALCQLTPPACLHIHPSCYHVQTVDEAAFGQSWSCHRHGVGVQDNRRVVQLLPALSVPTMVCLCSERSGRVALATFKPFLKTCDCVSGAQLCCREPTACVRYNRFEGKSWSEVCVRLWVCLLIILFLNEKLAGPHVWAKCFLQR